MKLIGIYLSERQLEYLKIESKEKDLSVSEIIRRVLDSYCFGELTKNTKFDKLKKQNK
jgi:hypothetical protein